MIGTYIIAEAGLNHNGERDMAFRLVDEAKKSGADAVKFQTFKAEHLILKDVQKAPYQQNTTDKTETQFDMLKKLEVSREQNLELKKYCTKKGIYLRGVKKNPQEQRKKITLSEGK